MKESDDMSLDQAVPIQQFHSFRFFLMEVDIKVLFFARSREIVGADSAIISTAASTSGRGLLLAICERFPGYAAISFVW
jgi:hypothetical protein